jgi:DNA-binding transcriptional MerR regulator
MQLTLASSAGQPTRASCPPPAARPAAPLTPARQCVAAQATGGKLCSHEGEDLIGPAQRSDTGYRHCTQGTVERVRAVRLLAEPGLRLREIGWLLCESGGDSLDTGRVQALAAAQLPQISARRVRLTLLRSDLVPPAAGNFGQLGQETDCRILEDFLAVAPTRLEATT